MIGQLEVIHGADKGRTFPPEEGKTVQIGRGQSTETKLCDPFVSRLHCQVKTENGHAILMDMGSAGGTFLNGSKLAQTQQLQLNDVIAVGDTQFLVQLWGVHQDCTVVRPAAAAAAAPTPALIHRAPTPAPLPDDVNDLVGHVLDHYEIRARIAAGRSGVIFQARDTQNNQTVALKVLSPQVTSTPEDVQRFVRSMKTMHLLRHPNLVAVLAHGQAGHFCWSAMEFVEGESLAQIIQRIGIGNILDWRHALRVAIHIARALEFAAQHQIIHRNITPPNILVRTSDGVAKLGDLTLAKALEGGSAQQITRLGDLIGELAYMAPERTFGNSEVDCRSDIYGLGATVYALLTGQPPCHGKNQLDTIHNIREVVPSSPRKMQLSVPESFEKAVLRMLAKKPQDRYQTATELRKALEDVAKENRINVP